MPGIQQDATISWLRAENHWLREEVRALAEALRTIARTAESLRALVYFDSLTGLPNRRLLDDTISKRLSVHTVPPFAVLFIDLDDFKRINDSVGHPAADALLRKVAATLDALIRSNDVLGPYVVVTGTREDLVLSRTGGDEFVILLPEVKNLAAAESVARRILQRFEQPFQADHRSIFITASIGIAIYPADGETADVLIQNADSAMYKAKQKGKARYECYCVPAPAETAVSAGSGM